MDEHTIELVKIEVKHARDQIMRPCLLTFTVSFSVDSQYTLRTDAKGDTPPNWV